MKRVAAAFLLFASTAAFAAEEKSTYIITLNRDARVFRAGATEVQSLKNLDTIAIADLTREEVLELKRSGLVRYIEPDKPVRALGRVDATALNPTHAGESHQSVPYGITMLRANDVWPVTTGAPRIKVGIADSGIVANHPDLAANYKGGYDWVQNDDTPQDENGHGTHVAGTIAALNNDIGVVGVAPNADIYALRVLDASGNGRMSSIVKAIDWAIENKLQVLNFSLGADDESPGLKEAFQKAADNNIVVVAASGNGYDDNPFDGLSYPAAFSTVISVGAVDSKSKIAAFSQRGPGLSVVAPGVAVRSTYLPGQASVAKVRADSAEFNAKAVIGTPARDASGKYVFGGLGTPEEIPAGAAGKIVVVRRGTYKFWEKVANAKTKGAIGVVIINNEPGLEINPTVVADPGSAPTRPGDPSYPSTPGYEFLPSQFISTEDGEAILRNPNATVTLSIVTEDYTALQGTSMATPHVAGLAALIWSLNPTATASQIRSIIEQTANDVGSYGYDTVFGHGIVDALSAARMLAPSKFPPAPPRKRPTRRN